MSILLDAVIRNKQQGQLPDPATTPRAYEQAQKRFPIKAAAAVVLSLLGGGVAAFGLNLLLNKEDPILVPTQQMAAVQQQMSAEPPMPAPQLQTTVTQSGLSGTAADEIRMAGRGNVPVAQPRPQYAGAASDYNVNSGSAFSRNAKHQASNTQAQEQREFGRLASGDNPDRQAVPAQAGGEPQALVLGANTNLTPEQLEILRREAGTAPEGMADLGQEAQAQQDNLLAAFEQALKEVEYQHSVEEGVSPKPLDPIPEPGDDGLPKFGDLPLALQQQVPDFNIVAHVYASNPDNRWLNVDGRELQQGDMIGGKLKIIEIRPRDVVLEVGGTEFTVPAI